jgi:hypothetical protein
VIALEHARLLGSESELIAPGVKIGDAREQRAIEIERVRVPREQRRDLAFDRFQFVGRVRGRFVPAPRSCC